MNNDIPRSTAAKIFGNKHINTQYVEDFTSVKLVIWIKNECKKTKHNTLFYFFCIFVAMKLIYKHWQNEWNTHLVYKAYLWVFHKPKTLSDTNPLI